LKGKRSLSRGKRSCPDKFTSFHRTCADDERGKVCACALICAGKE
jgi:hypothetical protein